MFSSQGFPNTQAEDFAIFGNDHLEVLLQKLAPAGEVPGIDEADVARIKWLVLKSTVLDMPSLKQRKLVFKFIKELHLDNSFKFSNFL